MNSQPPAPGGPPPQVQAVVPPASPQTQGPRPPFGGFFELFFFLSAAVVISFLIQVLAVIAGGLYLTLSQPGTDARAAVKEAARALSTDAFLVVPTQSLVLAAMIALAYLFVRVLRRVDFAEGIGWRRVSAADVIGVSLAGAALAIAISSVNLFFPPQEEMYIEKLFDSREASLLLLGMSVLIAPLAEEIIFRGYIFTLIENRWNVTAAILTSGVLFGAIHFYQLWPGYAQMAALVAVGLAFSGVRAWTGSTIAAIWMHTGYNAMISVSVLLSDQFHSLPAGGP